MTTHLYAARLKRKWYLFQLKKMQKNTKDRQDRRNVQNESNPPKPSHLLSSSILHDYISSTVMPDGKQHATLATVVLDILERRDQVGNTTETKAAAKNRSPATIKTVSNQGVCNQTKGSNSLSGVSRYIFDLRHLPLSAPRAVHRPMDYCINAFPTLAQYTQYSRRCSLESV